MNKGNPSLFTIFESSLRRPLTKREANQLLEWQNTYEEDEIYNALREAMIYAKGSFSYIASVLLADHNK